MLNRRSFFGSMAAMGVAGLTCAQEKSDSDTFLDTFPDAKDIPGIAHVRKVRKENAAKVLAVFRQSHWDTGLSKEQVIRTEECQLQLLHAMEALTKDKRARFHSVLNESTIAGQEKFYMDWSRRELRARVGLTCSFAVSTFITPPPGYIDRNQFNEKTLSTRLDGISILSYIGSAEVLALQYKLTVLAAEDADIKKKADRAKYYGTEAERQEWMWKRREQEVLRIGSDMKDTAVYTVYGYMHGWEESIEEWNTKEKTKYSLIEMTPESVHSHEEAQKKPRKPIPEFIPFW